MFVAAKIFFCKLATVSVGNTRILAARTPRSLL
jgi:hypothetical protein